MQIMSLDSDPTRTGNCHLLKQVLCPASDPFLSLHIVSRQPPPRPARRDHDYLLPEEYQPWSSQTESDLLSVSDTSSTVDTPTNSLPAKKKSSNSLIRIARQASDSAFRSVRLNKKASDNNLAGTATSVVYEQNPKSYIYLEQHQPSPSQQPQQSQQPHHQNPKSEYPARHLYFHQNNQSNISVSTNVSQRLAPPRPLKTELRRNISLPDLKSTVNNEKNASSTTVSRGTSLPVRQRLYPYHYVPQDVDNDAHEAASNPAQQQHLPLSHPSSVKCLSQSPATYEPCPLLSPTVSEVSSMNDSALLAQSHHQYISQSSNTHSQSSRLVISLPPPLHINQAPHQRHLDHQQHHQQQRTKRLTRHRTFSQESHPGYIDTRLFAVPEPTEKELPPTPPGSASPISPRSGGRLSHVVLPLVTSSLKRQDSVGFIPQDATRSMDQMTLQKVITQASVSSRVYKVMAPEQVDNLRKEQEDVQHFIEALNVSLHIESRMRDASHSLIRLHENNANLSAVRAANTQLNTTTRKMDQIVQKIQQSMWRLMAIQKMLLQHEGAVLNVGMRRLDSDNRELSRTVRHLEEAHNHEKEERIFWKNQHSNLKVQSIVLQDLPKSDCADENKGMMEKAMETEVYIRELQDEISQRREREADLEKRLQLVGHWVEDFSMAVDVRSPVKLTFSEAAQTPSPEQLQVRLTQLQSHIESEFKRLDSRVEDWKSVAEATTLTENVVIQPTRSGARMSSRYSVMDIDKLYRLSSHSNASSESRSHGDDMDQKADGRASLQVTLDERLIELERQIFSERSSSRPCSSSTSSSTISYLEAEEMSDTSSEDSVIGDVPDEIQKLD
ncbi:hypothetical protein BG004_007883 [Podila humilis]|nr:hypothetical protein BG004_007883 [Podila humilis]